MRTKTLISFLLSINLVSFEALSYECEELTPCTDEESSADENNNVNPDDKDVVTDAKERLAKIKEAEAAKQAAGAQTKQEVEVTVKVEVVNGGDDSSPYIIRPFFGLEGGLFPLGEVYPTLWQVDGGVRFPLIRGLYVDTFAAFGLWNVPKHTEVEHTNVFDPLSGRDLEVRRENDYDSETRLLAGLGARVGWTFEVVELAATSTAYVLDHSEGPVLQVHLGGDLGFHVSDMVTLNIAAEVPVTTTQEKEYLQGVCLRAGLSVLFDLPVE